MFLGCLDSGCFPTVCRSHLHSLFQVGLETLVLLLIPSFLLIHVLLVFLVFLVFLDFLVFHVLLNLLMIPSLLLIHVLLVFLVFLNLLLIPSLLLIHVLLVFLVFLNFLLVPSLLLVPSPSVCHPLWLLEVLLVPDFHLSHLYRPYLEVAQ